MSKFIITSHKGFNLTFNNGWQVSVQWGPGNYCDRREDDRDLPGNNEYWSSSNAEVAVWHTSNKGLEKMIMLQDDVVRGWTSADEVAELIYLVSTAESTITNNQMTKRLKAIWKEVA
mgnify:CR=1 FL=1